MDEIKELITFARAQRVSVLEARGLRFQFSPLAHDQPEEEKAKPKEAKTTEEAPYGHYKPEE